MVVDVQRAGLSTPMQQGHALCLISLQEIAVSSEAAQHIKAFSQQQLAGMPQSIFYTVRQSG